MKLNEIEVGGRYRAKVSGQMQTVRVVELREISTFGRDRHRTIIYAVNEATGRWIAIRSPQRLRCRVEG